MVDDKEGGGDDGGDEKGPLVGRPVDTPPQAPDISALLVDWHDWMSLIRPCTRQPIEFVYNSVLGQLTPPFITTPEQYIPSVNMRVMLC